MRSVTGMNEGSEVVVDAWCDRRIVAQAIMGS
jgi:hypothetical protein